MQDQEDDRDGGVTEEQHEEREDPEDHSSTRAAIKSKPRSDMPAAAYRSCLSVMRGFLAAP